MSFPLKTFRYNYLSPYPWLVTGLRSKFYILVKRKQIEKEAISSWHEKIPQAFGSSTRAKYEIQFLLG